MVVDISDPSDPDLLGEPLDPKVGESTRELRVWRSQDVLIVLNTNCGVGPTLHHCTQTSISNIRFYDISGRNAKSPQLLNEFKVDTHEFFLWEDPNDPERALIFAGNAAATCGIRGGAPSCPFSVWDISGVPDGEAPVTLYSGLYPYQQVGDKPTGGLHSLTISNDGSTAYFALLSGGFAIADVSEFAAGTVGAQPRPITDNASRPVWTGPGAHSAVKLWGRLPRAGERPVDLRDVESAEDVVLGAQPDAHAARRTQHLALGRPAGGQRREPAPAPPAGRVPPQAAAQRGARGSRLSGDPDTARNEKVVMWSYVVVQDGLLYVVDLRNGLYVLKYRGAFEGELEQVRYPDGNSNQGTALCYEPVGRTARHRCR